MLERSRCLRISLPLALLLSTPWPESILAACSAPAPLRAKLQTHPDAQVYAEAGIWFGEHQNYLCASDSFRSALKLEPSSPKLHYLLGLSLHSSGRTEEAISALRRSVELDGKALPPRLALGAALSERERYEEAKTQWENALRIDPESRVALDGLSKALLADGDYAGVIGLLSSLRRDEDQTLALAQAYARSGMLTEATQVLKQSLDSDPGSLKVAAALVTVLIRQGQYADATQISGAAMRLHPDDLEAKKLHLRVQAFTGHGGEAVPLARKLLIQRPHDVELLLLNGFLEREAGDLMAARDHLRRAVLLDPESYDARYNLGIVLARMQDASGAREQLERAIALGANEPQVHFELARVLQALGDKKAAKEQTNMYVQALDAESNRDVAETESARAAKDLANGDAQGAVKHYRQAVEAVPNNPLLRYKLAMALDRAGDIGSERAILEQAVAIDPTLAVAQYQLGYLAGRRGDSVDAEKRFRFALKAAPGYVPAWISLAAILGMESRLPEAREAVSEALRLDPNNDDALHLSHDLESAQP